MQGKQELELGAVCAVLGLAGDTRNLETRVTGGSGSVTTSICGDTVGLSSDHHHPGPVKTGCDERAP